MSVLTYKLTATIWKEQEGYVAKCSELGVASAGDSPSDIIANLKEAIELYLEHVMLANVLIPSTFSSDFLLTLEGSSDRTHGGWCMIVQ